MIDRGVDRYVEPSTTGASEAAGAGAASWLVEQIEWEHGDVLSTSIHA